MIRSVRRLILILTLVVFTMPWAHGQTIPDSVTGPPVINVIYPRDSQSIAPVDSTFILGSVQPPTTDLVINGEHVPVYESGGFLAYLPVVPGQFVFRLRATNDAGTDSVDVPVMIRDVAPIPLDSGAVILDGSIDPLWDRTVRVDDEIDIRCIGTVGSQVSFRVFSATDTTPFYPVPELRWADHSDFQSYRDAMALMADSVKYESLTGKGTYHTIWRVPVDLDGDSLRVEFELRTPPEFEDTVRAIAPGALVQVDNWPVRIVELVDSVQILRLGPRLGYLTIFQPYGVRARWLGTAGPWTIIEPAPGYQAWIETEKTQLLPEGTPVPGSRIARLITTPNKRGISLHVGTSERLPYKITVSDDLRSLELLIFGATSNTDWIEQDPEDDMIRDVAWSQSHPGVYEVAVRLHDPLWGYDAHYVGSQLVIDLRRPPVVGRGLSGMRIAVDAGHSKDPGAIGPTGLMEKDVNLSIAWEVKRFLERKGAEVVMTRWGNEDVPLYDRPAAAVAEDVDLFVSVHNNAVPDGVNPYVQNGTGTYYYHPFSHDLAKHVHRWTRDATGLDDYGLKFGNFAVIRPTQYPSVLVECAFIILPEQEALLASDEFVVRIGQGVANGVAEFVRERLGR